MHIKTGSWDGSGSACDSDALCDPAVLVAAATSQPHIRNRRLSPGSGGCGGGGGGCLTAGDQQQQPGDGAYIPGHALAQRRGLQKGRGQRREGVRLGPGRAPQKPPKERWVEDSLALLRPPPAFPVQDSPAKLLPAVSYASRVKAGPAALDDDPPAIGVLLQNQWGLSFISEVPGPASEAPGPARANSQPSSPPRAEEDRCDATPASPVTTSSSTLAPSSSSTPAVHSLHLARPGPEEQGHAEQLMLSCPHLADALDYHSREWRSIGIRQKDSKRVVWYKALEQPA